MLPKTIYIGSSCLWSIDVDGYCDTEAVAIAVGNFVAKLSLRGVPEESRTRRSTSEAGLARSSDHSDKLQARLAFGYARLEGERQRQRQMGENKHNNVTCFLSIFLSHLPSSLSYYISHALLDFGFG